MVKQVIEPQIVEPNQVIDRQNKERNNNKNTHFYYRSNIGCLGFVIAFLSLLLAIPMLIFGSLRKKK